MAQLLVVDPMAVLGLPVLRVRPDLLDVQ